jgi:hypothetical protein
LYGLCVLAAGLMVSMLIILGFAGLFLLFFM